MTDQQVIVVGAGPTGLAAAAELALAGVSCKVLEKRSRAANVTRAFGVSARTLELLDARGLADAVLARGHRIPAAQPNVNVFIDFTPLESRYNFMLIVPQSGTEEVLEQRCRELGVSIDRGAEVVGITQDDDGVDVRITGPDGTRTEGAAYVVGCDGAHSAVRRELGAEFVGIRYDVHLLLADVRLTDPPNDMLFARANEKGIQLLIPFGDGYHRSISFLHGASASDREPTLEEVGAASRQIAGADHGLAEMRWATRFHSERKQAKHYRFGRVFLAGDAAHVHSPAGAQGMNTGIGDAMNLGWKLAATIRGTAPAWLLDTYESERHPVGEQVLKVTDRMFRLVMIRSKALQMVARFGMRAALGIEAIQRLPRLFLSGFLVSYPRRGDNPHELAGKRAPDVTIGGIRLAAALRSGRFVLTDSTAGGHAAHVARSEYGEHVTTLAGSVTETGNGAVPDVMLVRPDGYVAWAFDGGAGAVDASARSALAEWCGNPQAATV